jgi:hypothetical protein
MMLLGEQNMIQQEAKNGKDILKELLGDWIKGIG